MEDARARGESRTEELREIGDEACWALSSAKLGNGIDKLRDGSNETFWQSDGPQPHLVNIQFHRKVKVSELRLHMRFKDDESYTPSCLEVRIGTAQHDLRTIQTIDLKEPDGWVTIRLARSRSETRPDCLNGTCVPQDPDYGGAVDFVRTHFVQLQVKTNHQNVRDTHIRQIQVYGPRGIGASSRSPVVTEGCSVRLQAPMLQQFPRVR